ncbi:hypothetical protein DDE82_006314 [Stemphylium lycopersici]|nr:hypothetical protein TW65_00277 [Stemphylium lycopersici]RAR01700.1 hypothetical protein DDE82_006314 [Stemphylium lycopersici]
MFSALGRSRTSNRQGPVEVPVQSDMHPMDRFVATPSSQHHVAFTATAIVGTATSDGCTCSSVPKGVLKASAATATAQSSYTTGSSGGN